MPFVAEKITEIFIQMLNKNNIDEDENVEVPDLKAKTKIAELNKNKARMKNKLVFMSKILKMQRLLREENEKIVKIKSENNNKLPRGILLEGK